MTAEMELAIPSASGLTLTSRGVVMDGDPSESQIETGLKEASRLCKALEFVIGDLIVCSEDKYHTCYEKWEDWTGLKKRRLQDVAATCRAIPLDQRFPQLSLEHHRAVTKLDPASRKKWLELAMKHGMGHSRLRKSIALDRVATNADMGPTPKTDSAYDTINPHVNRLTAYITKLEHDGELDSMDSGELLALFEDLSPLMTQMAGIAIRIEDAGVMQVIRDRDFVIEKTGIVSALAPWVTEAVDVEAELVSTES